MHALIRRFQRGGSEERLFGENPISWKFGENCFGCLLPNWNAEWGGRLMCVWTGSWISCSCHGHGGFILRVSRSQVGHRPAAGNTFHEPRIVSAVFSG
eukprot:3288797-Rhodomonas_salina.2